MYGVKRDLARRKRAPSKRSVETGLRILDAAERLFSVQGFEGTSVRDIANECGVTPALVNFHGGSKQQLFETVVERRAAELSALRIEKLEAARAAGALDLETVLGCFILPLLEQGQTGGPHWHAYARLVAIVSADQTWQKLTQRCFNPTVEVFGAEISRLYPKADPADLMAGIVYSVSAMLSLCTSQWRIADLRGDGAEGPDPALNAKLVRFCTAGMVALIGDA